MLLGQSDEFTKVLSDYRVFKVINFLSVKNIFTGKRTNRGVDEVGREANVEEEQLGLKGSNLTWKRVEPIRTHGAALE